MLAAAMVRNVAGAKFASSFTYCATRLDWKENRRVRDDAVAAPALVVHGLQPRPDHPSREKPIAR
jgi:phosphotransferase system IIB component